MTRRWPIGWSATGASATRVRHRSRPATAPPLRRPTEAPRFVVQEHHARRLHWDLRLEHDGVLASWAVPRGIPPSPDRNHLAVRTEDHPLEYLDFHGEIPAGQYGAGTMAIWDRGTYEEHKFRDDEVMVTFHGERVRGRYVLFRTKGDDWMIHRMDPPDDPDREPMPEQLAPMLATTGPLPPDDGRWAYEIKWDGVRAIAFVQGGRLELRARSGRDITPRYPELRPLAEALAGREVVLDGEVVAFDGARPSFQKLQGRMHLTSEHAVRRLARDDPVHYIAFDLLYLDGRSLMDLPLRRAPRGARRARAERPDLAGAGAPRRRRRGAARGDARAAARGRDREAARRPVPARTPLARLDQGPQHLLDRRRDRRLAARRRRPLRPARLARGRDPRRRRRPALRRPRRHRLHAGRAGAAGRDARAARARRQPVRAAASRRSRRASSSRGSSPASTTASAPRRERCASRRTRDCATTSRPRTCGSR